MAAPSFFSVPAVCNKLKQASRVVNPYSTLAGALSADEAPAPERTPALFDAALPKVVASARVKAMKYKCKICKKNDELGVLPEKEKLK